MMTTYVYTAKKSNAETVEGRINASSEEEAIDLINQLGLLPVSVDVADKEEHAPVKVRGTIKSKDRLLFSRQLANLLKSGLPLLKALKILEEQTHNRYFRRVIRQIADGVQNGRSFSECLEDYPQIFSNLFVTMVRAGEESSNLEEMLVHVSAYQKRQEDIKSKVKTAMTYPALMAFVGVLAVYFILTFVLPKMAGLFDSIGEALPLPTVILFALSDILTTNGWSILIGFTVLVMMIRAVGYLEFGKIFTGSFVLKIPLFGDIIHKSELSRFAQALVLLLKNGVAILRALDVAVPIISNRVLQADFAACKEALSKGDSFGETLKGSKHVPSIMAHTIAVGEESGHLNEVLTEIADSYEEETNEAIKVATTLIEPLMIMTIGLVIGFIIFAMLLPIFQIDMLAA